MLCSISGTVPEQPVVSKKSGHLYEKRLIVKVIKETGRDPVTSEALGEEDLLELTGGGAAKPRPTPATSIPGLLSLFQNEWDATMLEVHQLRQSLGTVRQELSHALYQHDAACRVIARLVRERDGLRAQLEAAAAAGALGGGGGKRGAGEAMEVDEGPAKKAKAGLSPAIAEKLTACSNELSKGRKKRQISPTVATPEEIAGYVLQSSHPLHKTNKGGILALDLSPASEAVVATAGGDADIKLYDRAAEQILATLSGHAKKVHDVKFVGSQALLASASADRTTKLWRQAGDAYECAHTFTEQAGEVVSVCVHPSHDFLVTAAGDGSWALYDVAAAACVTQVADEAAGAAYSCAALHPDGLILCTGTEDAAVRIWETRTSKNVAKFDGHEGRINSISFSENGYYMATAASDGVKLWDLRKLRNFKSLAPYESAPATAVAFDHSGLFLGVGGADARVYGVKQDWAVVKEFTDVPKKGVNALRFGADARSLLVGAADHNLRVFGAPQA